MTVGRAWQGMILAVVAEWLRMAVDYLVVALVLRRVLDAGNDAEDRREYVIDGLLTEFPPGGNP